MVQEQKGSAQLPGAGENEAGGQGQSGEETQSSAEHQHRITTFLLRDAAHWSRVVGMSGFANNVASNLSPEQGIHWRDASAYWYAALNRGATCFPVFNTGFTGAAPSADAPSSLIMAVGATSSSAVERAQQKLKKAQEELQEALDVERAMLELAQLREVRQLHKELYGPAEGTGQTAAQQYLASKQVQREQAPE